MKKIFNFKRKSFKVLCVILAVIIVAMLGIKVKDFVRVNRIMKAHEITVSDSTNSNLSVKTGVQQIMIGSLCTNYDNALQTLLNIKAAGYDGIELNSFMISDTGILVKLMTKAAGMPIGNGGSLDWSKLISESGLDVISLHSDLGSIENDPEAVAALAKSFGTKYVVITGMYRFDYGNYDDVLDLANRLNDAGKALSEYGISLLYHNHNCELQKVSSDQTAYDLIIENTDAEYVNFEFDSYWMTDGGANVPALMEKLGSRMKLWHINDRGCTTGGPYMTPILSENATELGYGNMDLDTLSEIAKENGVEAVIVETHKNWVNDDPIESFILSFDYLNKTFCKLQ